MLWVRPQALGMLGDVQGLSVLRTSVSTSASGSADLMEDTLELKQKNSRRAS